MFDRYEHSELEYAEQEIKNLKEDLEIWKELAQQYQGLVIGVQKVIGCEDLGDWLHEREMESNAK